jgi:hypothetical protein
MTNVAESPSTIRSRVIDVQGQVAVVWLRPVAAARQ